jgi:adenosylhomocysteine nucleosidase
MQPILIAVPQSNELRPLLGGLDRLGHPSEPIVIGNMPCYSIPSLGATAAVGGHGKTQFAVQCQYLIDRCDGLAALFCVGAAGSLSPDLHFGDVVVGEGTIEHDYKIRFEQAEAPCHAGSATLLHEFRQAAIGPLPFRVHFGPIASGDEDIVDEVRARELQQFTGAKCVAWEGSGGARAATFNGVPFLEIRAITDGADADAAASFRANCERVLPNIAELVVRWRLSGK